MIHPIFFSEFFGVLAESIACRAIWQDRHFEPVASEAVMDNVAVFKSFKQVHCVYFLSFSRNSAYLGLKRNSMKFMASGGSGGSAGAESIICCSSVFAVVS